MCDADENNENDREVLIDNEKEYIDYYKCDKEIYLWMKKPRYNVVYK